MGAPRPLPRVIAVANQKGGVGKTTTTVNLGAALAELDYRVLVIDLDPQGNATTGLGIDARNFELSMYDVIMRDTPLEDCIEPTSVKNLFVAPATIDLAGVEIELVPAFSRELKLKKAIDDGGRRLRLRAHRLPPVARPHHRQRPGGGQRGPGPDPVRVLRAGGPEPAPAQRPPGGFQPQQSAGGLDDRPHHVRRPDPAGRSTWPPRSGPHFADTVCESVIPRTVRLSEAPSFGQPITVFDPTSRGAVAYRELAKEVSNGAPKRAG